MQGHHIFLAESQGRIEEAYAKRKAKFPEILKAAEKEFCTADEETVLAVKYLYSFMPYSDLGNYTAATFLDYAKHSVFLWKTQEEVRKLPEDIYLNYVLYHRVNEEEIAPCRSFFYEQMADRIRGMKGEEAAKEVNYWCAEEASYHCTDDRTLSAISVYRRGNGRCGEESVFTVNAMRSVGIPARQVYAPKWSHCDDNHAWVEVWLDGKWYFTGACEPEQILNRGWFTNASSRAMMVHSRLFDEQIPDNGCVIGKDGITTMLNELERYAKVKEIEVQVMYEDGTLAAGVEVLFEVLNYSEYAPIAECRTDENGKALLVTGMGSLHIHVREEDKFAEAFIDVRKEDKVKLCLKETDAEECWKAYDMIAPKDAPINADMPTKEQKEAGNQRLALAEAKRLKKVETWVHTDRETFLKSEDKSQLREKMLEVLTEKDQTDLRRDVLEEHLKYAAGFEGTTKQKIFIKYILNPRVEDEVLQTYRAAVLETLTEEEQEAFKKEPKKIWNYIKANIKEEPEGERASVITTPAACLKLHIASRRSQRILFVAVARTLGVPARLNPHDGNMEYYVEGNFVPVEPETEKNCRLSLYEEGQTNWKYFQNWSIARLTNGRYVSLKLNEAKWEGGKLNLSLEPGRYRILTSNRLPNGNIFANQYEFVLKAGEEKEVSMQLRKADLSDMLENLAIPEFELRNEAGEAVKASKLTENGKHIMMFLEEGKEPTEHILNEMLEQEKEFASYADRILFVIRSKEAKSDRTVSKALKAFPGVEIYYDDFTENVNMLGRRMYVDHEKLPLIIVTNGMLNGIYATSGYNVGTGDMLLRLLDE